MKEIFQNISYQSFESLFDGDNRCLEFLANEKWKEGFCCSKCGNTSFHKGKTLLSRKCNRCKHEESVIAHTVFHHCKIPLQDAFRIGYLVCNNPDISTYEIARILGIRQMTAWRFKKRIMDCIAAGGKFAEADLSSASAH